LAASHKQSILLLLLDAVIERRTTEEEEQRVKPFFYRLLHLLNPTMNPSLVGQMTVKQQQGGLYLPAAGNGSPSTCPVLQKTPTAEVVTKQQTKATKNARNIMMMTLQQ
jgi:hypothetical protein